jgi:hypothetical protein
MIGFSKLVTAAKDYTCSEHSHHRITTGSVHLFQSMPPWHDMNDSQTFITYRTCLRCAKHYGLLDGDMRRQVGCEPFTLDPVLSMLA